MSLDNVSTIDGANGLPPSVLSEIDIERHLPKVRAHFVSDEEALACLRVLANVMCNWVDIGWGVDSFHLAFPMLAEFSSEEQASGLNSSHQNIDEKFNAATRAAPGSETT